MKLEEFTTLTGELVKLVTPENQARTTEILTALTEDFTRAQGEAEQSASRIAELTANNETLRDVNAKLFLKVGTPDPNPKPDHKPEPGTVIPEMSYNDLFNEKGEIK